MSNTTTTNTNDEHTDMIECNPINDSPNNTTVTCSLAASFINAYNKSIVRSLITNMNKSVVITDKQDSDSILLLQHNVSADGTCVSCNGPMIECRTHLTKTYDDQSYTSGEVCNKTGRRWSRGVFVNRHGDKYDGDWFDDKRSGRGTFRWINGDVYDGEWKNGTMEGHGAFRWANGDGYIGQWKQGRMDGHGIKTMANGDSYEGEWKNDKANGHGCKKFACGDIHEGEYKDDRRHGHGVYIWVIGDKYDG